MLRTIFDSGYRQYFKPATQDVPLLFVLYALCTPLAKLLVRGCSIKFSDGRGGSTEHKEERKRRHPVPKMLDLLNFQAKTRQPVDIYCELLYMDKEKSFAKTHIQCE